MRATRSRFIAGSSAGVAAFSLVAAPAKAAEFEFKCGSNLPIDHPEPIRLVQMWNAVERESGGRIRTQLFPNSQLGSETAMFSQLRLGALHFFLISSGNLATVVPPIDIENLGFVYADANEGARVMEGRLGAYLRQEAAARGVYAFRAVWNSGMSQVISNTHPIRNPDDLHGFKLRTAESKILIDLFRRLGASPSPLSLAETYTALQTKLIDGEALSVGTIYATRHFEVGKYISMTNHGWSGPWMIANGETWRKLPPNLQEIVERNNTKYSLLERRDLELNTAAVTDKLRRQGIEFNPVDPAQFRARLGSYYDAWRGEFGTTSWDLLQTSLGRKLI